MKNLGAVSVKTETGDIKTENIETENIEIGCR